MQAVFPVLIKPDKKHYLVFVPDFDIYTQGKNFFNAIEMARDAIELGITLLEDEGKPIPNPSEQKEAFVIAQKNADKNLDFSNGMLTYVDVDSIAYRKKMSNRAVKKNCTIPSWLNDKAEKAGINFSRVLQDALIAIVDNN